MNYNESNYNELPENMIQMSFRNWTDPGFFMEDNEDPSVLKKERKNDDPLNAMNDQYFVVNDMPVRGNTTLAALGLALSNSESNENPTPLNTIRRRNTVKRKSSKRRQKSKSRSRSKSRSKKRKSSTTNNPSPVKSNNRFGFKKLFSSLTRGLKKLTGQTRKNRS